MSKLEALLEAERRGILPESKAPMLAEARRRGLIPAIEQAAPEPQAERVYTQAEVLERARLQDELNRNLALADEAGKRLEREESIARAVRPVLQGFTTAADAAPIVAIPRLAANLGVEVANRTFGTEIPKVPGITPKVLQPQNTAERFSTAVTGGVSGALGTIGVGQQLANSANQATQGVGQVLASNPTLQAAQAVTGATSGQAAAEAGLGPVGQTVASLAGSLAPSVAASAVNKVATGLTRTEEAQRLLDQGVDLTPGQLNPKGIYNQLEENVQSLPLVGPIVRSARENARETFQRAAVQRGAAPGTSVTQADPATMLDDAYASFKPLYDQAKGFPVRPEIVNQGANTRIDTALRTAIRNPGVLATDEQRKNILRFVNSQLTKGIRTSDDLLDIRSSIRAEARQRIAQGDPDSARLLNDAAEVVTRSLESQLPTPALTALKTADSQYGNYKIVERAVARAKDRGGRADFTPNDLSEAVAQQVGRGAGQGSYARGAGGAVRELASDGRAVLDARSPPTGQRLAVLAPGAAALAIDPATGTAINLGIAGSVLALSGTQTGRRIAAGTTDVQRAIKRQIDASNINVPLSYKQALATNVTQQASEQLAKVTPARELVFLDPESSPEQAALAKVTIARTDPDSYRAMVREFLADSYSNRNSVAQDPRRIRAVLPADAPDALNELIQATQGLSNAPQVGGKGAVSEALRQRSIGNIQFLLTPGQADPQSTGAAIDTLTDVLIDPEKRLKLRQATRIKDPEKQLLILGSLFNPVAANVAQ
jgi:hypothetical protein